MTSLLPALSFLLAPFSTLALGVLFAAPVHAQTWNQQYPPNLPDAVDVALLSAVDLWVAGSDGTLRHSTNGGVNWTDLDLAAANFTSVAFADAARGLAAGDGIWQSADGGQSWTRTSNEQTVALSFLDVANAWALTGDSRVLATADGGQSWTDLGQPSGAPELLDLQLLAGGEGWVVGASGTTMHTSDGGANWTPHPSGTNASLPAVHFVDSQTGWVCAGSRIRRTINGGQNWTLQQTPSSSPLSDVTFLTTQRGWACGADGTLLSTNNGGSTWSMGAGAGTASLGALGFVDFFSGFAVGQNGTVLESSDGGSSWTQIAGGTPVPEPVVYGIDALDELNAWATTTEEQILRTTDGGATWDPVPAGTNNQWRDVSFFDTQNGYACGEQQSFFPSIAFTHDGGLSWTTKMFGLMVDFNDVEALGPNTALVAGETFVWRTADGGLSWNSAQPMPFGTYHGMDFFDAQTGWIAGNEISQTHDGGLSWSHLVTPPATMLDVGFADLSNGWCVGEGGRVMSTFDGGSNWVTTMAPSVPGNLTGISVVDALNLWIVGDWGYVARSADGGGTWVIEQPGLSANAQPHAVKFVSAQKGWIGGWFEVGLWGRDATSVRSFCAGDGTANSCPCGNFGVPGHGCENTQLTGGALLEASGLASVSADSMVLSATGLINSSTGLYFQGTSEVNAGAGSIFGDGLRCAGGTLQRLVAVSSVGGASAIPGFGGLPLSTLGAIPAAGATRYYQLWYRDPAAVCGNGSFNLTNALEIVWTP